MIAHQRGEHRPAVEWINRAIALQPHRAQFHTNLGLALKSLDQLDDAAASFERSLELKPENAVAYNNLGVICLEQQRAEDAAFCFRQARRLNDGDPAVFNNLGRSLLAQGKVEQAIGQFEKAIDIDPRFVEAHCRLGIAYRDQGDTERAIAQFERVLEIAPDHVEALNSLGAALVQTDRAAEAETRLRRAIKISPRHASAHNNLGLVLMNTGRLDEAEASLRAALRLKPDFASAKSNLGAVLLQQGKIDRAIEALEDALRIQPDIVDGHWNHSLALLARGDYLGGWLEYEWRWLKPGRRRKLPRPLWDGSPLDGKTILLHAEQGLGDTLQFVRYASLVSQRGGRVLLACQKPLVPLLSGCADIDQVVAQSPQLPPFDVHAPLMSLPSIFRTTIETLPAAVPYITVPYVPAEADLVAHWQEKLSEIDGFKIGIAWQGNPNYPSDRTRSIPLPFFEALVCRSDAPRRTNPGHVGPALRDGQNAGHTEPSLHHTPIRLISLQKGHGVEQIAEVRDRFEVIELGGVDEDHGPFMDTAAIMKNLDLVITSDTVIPHLAGALGVPVWMALSAAPDWRWISGGDRSPWYPTMRIFRQRERGNWHQVFARMARELEEMAKK